MSVYPLIGTHTGTGLSLTIHAYHTAFDAQSAMSVYGHLFADMHVGKQIDVEDTGIDPEEIG